MRILHTSDWHIGRKFHEFDLTPDQAIFCDWIVDLAKSERIDTVVISGDVFDRANPRAEAVDLLDDVLHRLRSNGSTIVMISGNHDSAERLNFGSRFMAGGGLHIATERQQLGDMSGVIDIPDSTGDVISFLPLPYLDPNRVHMDSESERSHAEVLRQLLDLSIAHLADPAKTVVLSHAFVSGSSVSDSERSLEVGGTGAVPSDLFRGFGYVALGHLHKPQPVGDGNVFYSGSPLSYSFSEEHQKSVRIVDTANGFASHPVNVGVGRSVATIRGTMESLLGDNSYEKFADSFVRVVLTDETPQIGAMDLMRRRFPFVLDLDMEVLHKKRYDSTSGDIRSTRTDPKDVVKEYVNEHFPDDDAERDDFLTDSIEVAFEKVYSA